MRMNAMSMILQVIGSRAKDLAEALVFGGAATAAPALDAGGAEA
jgi:hypothetical protein